LNFIKQLNEEKENLNNNKNKTAEKTDNNNNNKISQAQSQSHLETNNNNNNKASSSGSLSGEDKNIKLVGFQKAMTKTMTQANLIPSFLFTEELDVDKLVKIRKEINSSAKKNDVKITFTPFFIKALSLSLSEFPILNSIVNPNLGNDGYIYEYTLKNDHNISIAIDTTEGLVVPNIKKVQNKSVMEIQKDLNFLVDKSKNRKLTNDDLTNGTFSCSNIGN
jgi:2-oxoisovalerate dehydrogenase E2 component (dihydrolipoyl transacylase)